VRTLYESIIRFLQGSKKTILLIIAVSLITLFISAMVAVLLERSGTLTVPSVGTVHTLGVEAYGGDLRSENHSQYVEWGTVFPDMSVNRSFYLRSIGNTEGILHLDTQDWNPPGISQYLNLSWNREGISIRPQEETLVTLTLTVASSHEFVEYVINNSVTQFALGIRIETVQRGY
jgi:hypothetical protein